MLQLLIYILRIYIIILQAYREADRKADMLVDCLLDKYPSSYNRLRIFVPLNLPTCFTLFQLAGSDGQQHKEEECQ